MAPYAVVHAVMVRPGLIGLNLAHLRDEPLAWDGGGLTQIPVLQPSLRGEGNVEALAPVVAMESLRKVAAPNAALYEVHG